MPTRQLFAAIVLLLPAAASAADNAARCMALGKELASTPTVIGSTQTANSHAKALSDITAATREIRAEMQRLRCGTGSIVTFGRNDPCRDLEQQLMDSERDRQAVLASRTAQGKLVNSLGRDPDIIRKEMLQLKCGEIDYANVPASINPDAPGSASSIQRTDTQKPGSSVIMLGKARPAQPRDTSPVPPVREWKPDQPVRTVGPLFYPDSQDAELNRPGIEPTQ
ncbi:hypothetical protein [Rhizobium sp. FKY42]|uniref:hypothetical protein n=1 Tax=Rhizobium sp. FKY42 TaxID=2562310 RepID=UPI0010BFF481|nr:hypothetical protein [Rhizobium sp. FKY42]